MTVTILELFVVVFEVNKKSRLCDEFVFIDTFTLLPEVENVVLD
jgi:hypothetical protein